MTIGIGESFGIDTIDALGICSSDTVFSNGGLDDGTIWITDSRHGEGTWCGLSGEHLSGDNASICRRCEDENGKCVLHDEIFKIGWII